MDADAPGNGNGPGPAGPPGSGKRVGGRGRTTNSIAAPSPGTDSRNGKRTTRASTAAGTPSKQQQQLHQQPPQTLQHHQGQAYRDITSVLGTRAPAFAGLDPGANAQRHGFAPADSDVSRQKGMLSAVRGGAESGLAPEDSAMAQSISRYLAAVSTDSPPGGPGHPAPVAPMGMTGNPQQVTMATPGGLPQHWNCVNEGPAPNPASKEKHPASEGANGEPPKKKRHPGSYWRKKRKEREQLQEEAEARRKQEDESSGGSQHAGQSHGSSATVDSKAHLQQAMSGLSTEQQIATLLALENARQERHDKQMAELISLQKEHMQIEREKMALDTERNVVLRGIERSLSTLAGSGWMSGPGTPFENGR